MDQMLPSPGFSIPSIGTPFQQLEEDQTIIANNPYYAQHSIHPPTGLTPVGMGNASTSNNGVGSSGLNTNVNVETSTSATSSLPSLMNTPTKGSSYQPSYQPPPPPQSLMQPQTPVCIPIDGFCLQISMQFSLMFWFLSQQQSLMSPMVPMTERVSENVPSVNVHPMTPMTPGSQDPAILPQLQ